MAAASSLIAEIDSLGLTKDATAQIMSRAIKSVTLISDDAQLSQTGTESWINFFDFAHKYIDNMGRNDVEVGIGTAKPCSGVVRSRNKKCGHVPHNTIIE